MANVELKGVSKSFGAQTVLHDIDLTIADGEFVVIVGPSGCGKSTLLRIIAGLEAPSAGDVLIEGESALDLSPARRGVAMVFQSYALYPHLNVYDNMAFGLRMAHRPEGEIRAAVNKAAHLLGIETLLQRKPKELSGGQRQRVAIGRAIVRQPRLFLLDEPLSNLDAALRVHMRHEFARLHRELATTLIYVTHDQIEAMTLANRIVVMNGGRIEQTGTPADIYDVPQNLFVAGFLGSPRMNLIAGEVAALSDMGVRVRLVSGETVTAAVSPDGLRVGQAVTAGVRPEVLGLGKADNRLTLTVDVVETHGAQRAVYGALSGADRPLCALLPGGTALVHGDRLTVGFAAGDTHLFDSNGLALPRVPALAKKPVRSRRAPV